MATTAGLTEVVLYDTLVNYLVSMARTVEGAMNRALDAIVSLENPRTGVLPGEVFLLEPRINEMEIVIDEHAIRLLRRGSFSDDEMRLIVAALKITNDLERIGDIAVNLAERATNIAEDIIFWVRGLDVRHGRGLAVRPGQSDQLDSSFAADSALTENSHVLHSGVTAACDTERA